MKYYTKQCYLHQLLLWIGARTGVEGGKWRLHTPLEGSLHSTLTLQIQPMWNYQNNRTGLGAKHRFYGQLFLGIFYILHSL